MPVDNKTIKNRNNKPVRTRKEIKRSLLRRAFDEDRGPEIIAEILERNARIKEQSEADRGLLLECRLTGHGQPRSVQLLNALARLDGSNKRFTDTSNPPIIH